MKRSFRALALAIAVASAPGCAAHWPPLRLPQRDLWSAAPVQPEPLRMPARQPSEYSYQLHQGGVTVGIDLPGPRQAEEAFHLNLAREQIQAVMVMVQNHSGRPYALNKSDLGRVIPAAKVAAMASPHPARVLARHVKWIALLVPGLVFESVVEPATTFDFPIMREASRRPSWPRRRDIRQLYAAQEFADGMIAPGATRSGVVFVRPLTLDSTLTITLHHADTNVPLTLQLPTPSATVSQVWITSQPRAALWPEVLEAARRVSSWRIQSADHASGRIRILKRSEVAPWKGSTPVTVTVRSLTNGRAQVTAEGPLPRPVSTAVGTSSQTVERFFSELQKRFPPPPPPPPPPAPARPPASS